MKDDNHDDGYGNQFDTSTSFSADTTNESTFKYGVQFNATTSSSANDAINESRNVNDVIGPHKFESYASTSAEDATGGCYNGFGAIGPIQCDENAIDGGGSTSTKVVAMVHHDPLDSDGSATPEYLNLEWLEESFRSKADEYP